MTTVRKATRFRSGQTLGATQLNRIVDAVNTLASAPAGAVPAPVGQSAPFHLEIKQLEPVVPGTLLCVSPGQSANPAAFEWTIELPGIFTETSRDFGGTIGAVSYVYTNINTRDATGPGGTETQYVTPPFVVGETIEIEAINDGSPYRFVADGRMWAVDPPS